MTDTLFLKYLFGKGCFHPLQGLVPSLFLIYKTKDRRTILLLSSGREILMPLVWMKPGDIIPMDGRKILKGRPESKSVAIRN